MIQLTYDAYNGLAFRDGEVESFVDVLIRRHQRGDTVHITFSTENLLYAIRVHVRQGYIEPKDVDILFRQQNGDRQRMLIDRHGNLDDWPQGFCDYTERWLEQLL